MTPNEPRPPAVSITLVRRLAAPVERAWRTWTDPRLMTRWLAPGADVVTSIVSDLRAGGAFRIEGRHAEGVTYVVTGTYLSLEAPRRAAMSWCYDGPVSALKGPASVVTAEFVALDATTSELTLTHERLDDRAAGEVNRINWASCIDKFTPALATAPEPGPAPPAPAARLNAPRPEFFSAGHRALQDRFATRRLADRVESTLVHDRLRAADAAFITRQNMFFLATADAYGQPNCSYKGGARGFVTVVDDHLVADYDGNGMHISSGNIDETSKIGMLFVDFEQQSRMRVLGRASVSVKDSLLARYPGARMIVRVAVDSVFSNCPRYVHRMTLVEESIYVPDAEGGSPVPAWKRLHGVADVLPEEDESLAGNATDVNKTLNRES